MVQILAHPAEVQVPSVRAAQHQSLHCASVKDRGWTLSHCGSDSPSATAALGNTLQESCEHSMQKILWKGEQVS